MEIMSYGSYIYHWPSKYDAVYWPYTASAYTRFSPISGYIAFGSDFLDISDEEKKRVAAFLKKSYDKEKAPKSHEERLDWLAKVYQAREADDAFWLNYYCLRAYLSRGKPKQSKSFRQEAIKVAQRLARDAEPGFDKAKAIFVLGSYSHMLGQKEQAQKHFAELKALKWKVENPEEASTSEDVVAYFTKLADALKSDEYEEEYFKHVEMEEE